jgi:hypothetical protein
VKALVACLSAIVVWRFALSEAHSTCPGALAILEGGGRGFPLPNRLPARELSVIRRAGRRPACERKKRCAGLRAIALSLPGRRVGIIAGAGGRGGYLGGSRSRWWSSWAVWIDPGNRGPSSGVVIVCQHDCLLTPLQARNANHRRLKRSLDLQRGQRARAAPPSRSRTCPTGSSSSSASCTGS